MTHTTDIAMMDQSPSEQLGKIKVLIMDSNKNAAELIKDIFSELGFANVIVANDGFQGVQIMKDERIDLIFTDRELSSLEYIKF